MIFDIILGRSLNTNYISGMYTNRIESEEISDYPSLLRLMHASLKDAFSHLDNLPAGVPDTVDSILTRIGSLAIAENLDAGVDVTIRELLSALAYEGYEFYIIRREDLHDTSMTGATRAYMLDKQDSYFPTINRVVNGHSITFDNPEDASISTVIMQFMQDMSFDDVVADTIELKDYQMKYEALDEAHMGWTLNVSNLIRFLSDYGYNFIVVM